MILFSMNISYKICLIVWAKYRKFYSREKWQRRDKVNILKTLTGWKEPEGRKYKDLYSMTDWQQQKMDFVLFNFNWFYLRAVT